MSKVELKEVWYVLLYCGMWIIVLVKGSRWFPVINLVLIFLPKFSSTPLSLQILKINVLANLKNQFGKIVSVLVSGLYLWKADFGQQALAESWAERKL